MIPPKIPIIVFSLCRAPPIKFYVTGYVVRGFDPFRLHSSLRSHTVGVSHVAHAYVRGCYGEPSIYQYMASEHKYRKVKHQSHAVM